MKSAQDDAKEARDEARLARTDASAAHKEADDVRVQAAALRRDFDAIQDWVDRVVRAADAYRADMQADGRAIEDSGVLRMMRAINGGPHLEPR